jgi:hypothetical protein
MSQMIRRTVVLTALTAALLFVVPAPSHAAHLRGVSIDGPAALAGDLVNRAWSWVEGLLGASRPTATAQRTSGLHQKDVVVVMPPVTNPPGGTTGSGSAIDPDGRSH